MHIGTAWYPEYFPRQQWDRDLALIRDAGITTVRFAEFAWSQIEPEPGRFDTDWIDDALAAFQRHNLTAVIGTPTATPPLWLSERHPDTLPVDEAGRRAVHGARQHRCYSAPAYRDHSRRVVEHLAQRFGHHPAVVAWQIDNEIGGEAKACYCDLCAAAFRRWLRPRYDGIQDLNRRWGTAFWSQTYPDFDRVAVPRRTALQLGLKHNPSLLLEWMRFHSDNMVDYCHEQADVLRRHVRPGAPITTNYDAFDWGENIDVRKMFDKLDVVGFDLYSDKPEKIAFYCDLMFDLLGKPFWMLEYGTDSPNLRAELDAVAASGTIDRFFFFKFRPFPWGQEQNTRSLITLTGAPAPNYDVLRRWTATPRPAPPPPPPAPRRVGLVYDFDSSWAKFLTGWSGVPADLTYPRSMIETVYASLHALGHRARFVLRPGDLRDLDLLLLPWTIIHDPALEDALCRHVAAGGSVLMTQDVFLKNRDNVYNETLPRLYTDLLNRRDNFLDHERPTGDHALVHEASAGDARLVVLAANATRDDWTHWIRTLAPRR